MVLHNYSISEVLFLVKYKLIWGMFLNVMDLQRLDKDLRLHLDVSLGTLKGKLTSTNGPVSAGVT